MGQKLQIFNDPEFGDVRGVEIDGEPWLVGKDVAMALGYSDTAQAIRKHIDGEDKGVVDLTTPGGVQKTTIINESGFYSLVFSSKLPGAKKFKRWVTSEILPSIRKHGAYMTPEALKEALANPEYAIEVFKRLKEEQDARIAAERRNEALEKENQILSKEEQTWADKSVVIRLVRVYG